jgi:hypothetical protein
MRETMDIMKMQVKSLVLWKVGGGWWNCVHQVSGGVKKKLWSLLKKNSLLKYAPVTYFDVERSFSA